MSHRVKRMLDAVELALYQGLFASCAEEMGGLSPDVLAAMVRENLPG